MTKLFVKSARGYRVATRTDVVAWTQATLAAEVLGRQLTSPADAADFLREALAASQAEHFAVVYMTNRHQVLALEIPFRGTVDSTSVYPREIVRRALELNAAAVVFAHNHPSGIANPSEADRIITQRLRSALELIDVRVLDHFIVVPRGTPLSMAGLGLI